MKTWFRWVLLVVAIGGSFTGLVVTVQAMSQQEAGGLISCLFYGIAVVLYLFTIVSGLLFADNPKRIIPLMIAFGLQIPWVSSPILVYSFCAGFRITAGLLDGRLVTNYRFGSDFQFLIFGDHPWGVGINFFAVLILILLAWYSRTPPMRVEITAVRFRNPVNIDDFVGWLTGMVVKVDRGPVKRAIFRRASGSKSVK
jgi:hypothetical protein